MVLLREQWKAIDILEKGAYDSHFRAIVKTVVDRRGLVEEEWVARAMQRDWEAIVMVQERDNKPGLGW